MYLSRVEIDDNNRQKIMDLSHLGAYHNWVENCFPSEIAHHERLRHLWRIDNLQGKRYLLLVSEEKPNLTELQRYGVPETATTIDYQPFLNKLEDGQVVRFRLVANPVYRTHGKYFPHVTVKQQMNWLIKRAAKAGFEFTKVGNNGYSFDIVNRDWPLLFHKNNRVKLSRVTFEGSLKITNANVLVNVLRKGIGRERAYGMGMLTVIPQFN